MALSGFIHRVRGSKAAGVVLALTALLVLPGCWVSSVNGLVEGGLFRSDPDVTFDQRLTGAWEVTSDNCTEILTITKRGSDLRPSGISARGAVHRGWEEVLL
jgi:hypothetical protein